MNADQYAENAHCSDLIARLEKAEAGSRELDAEIATAVLGWKWIAVEQVWELPAGSSWPQSRSRWGVTAYTTSLDAIVALIGEKLPGMDWTVSSTGEVYLVGPNIVNDWFEANGAKTPALALCSSLLRALQAKEGEHG